MALDALSDFDGCIAPCANDPRKKRVKRRTVGAIFCGDVVMRLIKRTVNKGQLKNVKNDCQPVHHPCTSSLY
jgi:hypothetical protein